MKRQIKDLGDLTQIGATVPRDKKEIPMVVPKRNFIKRIPRPVKIAASGLGILYLLSPFGRGLRDTLDDSAKYVYNQALFNTATPDTQRAESGESIWDLARRELEARANFLGLGHYDDSDSNYTRNFRDYVLGWNNDPVIKEKLLEINKGKPALTEDGKLIEGRYFLGFDLTCDGRFGH